MFRNMGVCCERDSSERQPRRNFRALLLCSSVARPYSQAERHICSYAMFQLVIRSSGIGQLSGYVLDYPIGSEYETRKGGEKHAGFRPSVPNFNRIVDWLVFEYNSPILTRLTSVVIFLSPRRSIAA